MKERIEGKSWLRTAILAGVLITTVFAVFSSPIAANQPPVAIAEPETQTIYVGESAWFTGNASYDPDGFIISYDWNFGDGSGDSGMTVTHTYDEAGNYTVILTVMDDNNATDTDNVFVFVLESPAENQPPVAFFIYSPLNPIVEEEVTFDASSSYDPDGSIISYEWDFDDGSTGSGMIITHTYLSAGTFAPALTVTDDDGATGYYTSNLTVSEEEPQFAWIESLFADKNSYCTGDIIDVTVVVQRGNDTLTVVWEGTLTLEVYDGVGNVVYTDSRNVTIVSGGGTVSLYFEFALSQVGNYTIQAILTGMFNVYDVDEIYIIVEDCGSPNQQPSVTIDLPIEGATICHSHGYAIQGSASDDDEVELVQVAFDNTTFWFDATDITDRFQGPDGPIYTEPWTKWIYSWDTTQYEDGWHTIYARAWDGELYSDLYSVHIQLGCESGENESNISPVAIVQPQYQTVYVGDTVYLDGSQSYDPDGYIASYEWDFGDGSTGNGVIVSHVYTEPGNYTVTLTVTDDEGATDIDYVAISVLDDFISYIQPPASEIVQNQNNLWWISILGIAIVLCTITMVLNLFIASTLEKKLR